MKRIGLLSVAFAAMLTVACGGDGRDERANPNSDTPAVGTAGEADRNRVSNRTQDWVKDRLVGGMTEVKLGELASQKSQNADVKAFGRMMVQDHTKAGEELKQIATQANITAPMDLDETHRQQVDKLSNLQGGQFDRDYINQMVDNHEETMNAIEDRVDNKGDDRNPQFVPKQTDDQFDTRVNQWAAKVAPTVRQHLERAKEIKDRLGRRTTDDR
jgi:putative membrane protein